MEVIKMQLVNIAVGNYESKYYIPFAELEQLLDSQIVQRAIAESGCEPYLQKEAVATVMNGGKRVFGILAQTGSVSAIMKVIEHDHLQIQPLDAKLPYTESIIIGLLGESQGKAFYRAQWAFIAPLFRGDLSHRTLDRATILPFASNRKIGQGAFGTVYEVTLNIRHQGDAAGANLPSDLKLVRKEMDIPSAQENLVTPLDGQSHLYSEGHVLSFLRLIRHPSIVRLIGSYCYRDTYNLLFERAESNLGELLARRQLTPALQADDAIFQAMQGLCEAVASFHRFTDPVYGLDMKGYHHDLKPENILVDGPRLLLSDFGLSSLKDIKANSKTLSKGAMGYYIAPECEAVEDGFERKMVGQPSDIWALGCILAIVFTYIRFGPAGITEFEQRRRYKYGNWTTYAFHQAGAVSPPVIDWLNELERGASPEGVGLLRLIREMLNIAPSKRPAASAVCSSMDHLAANSIYRLTLERFGRQHNDLILSLEKDRLTLAGQCFGLSSSVQEWRTDSEPDDGEVDFKKLKGFLLDLQAALDLPHATTHLPSIVRNVQTYVDAIWNLLPSHTRSRLRSIIENRIVGTTDLTILDSIQDRFKDKIAYRNIGLIAATKAMILLANQSQLAGQDLALDPAYVPVVDSEIGPSSSWAKLLDPETGETKHCLMEWLEYDYRWQNKVGGELFQRMQNIANILHDEEKSTNIRSLRCWRYYHALSRHSFGLLFDVPCAVRDDRMRQHNKPITLADLIARTRAQRRRPDLGTLFRLSQILALTVLQWHKIGWVHRRISSYNIVLFAPDSMDPFASILDPYFLGFQFSRPAVQSAFTTGPPAQGNLRDYCHPAYLKGDERHLPEYDYYSLGLILLEIAYWKTLEQLVKNNFNDEDQSPQNLLSWLLQNPVAELHMVMGGVYEEAVKTCLTFQSDHNSMEDYHIPLGVLERFQQSVSGPLARCFA